MLNIALFGPPGAGKGTQSKLLVEKYNLTYISTGDILRKEIAEKSDLGLQAKSIIESGGLVSDDIMAKIIEYNINKNRNSNGILFDGFPRTTVQAVILDDLLNKMGLHLSCMISLAVPQQELIHRLLERAKIEGRKDDTPEAINVRLREYEEKTTPVAKYYEEKGIYYPVNGTGTVNSIFERLTETIDRVIQHKH